ncbi:MAG: hypothetical protein K2M96_00145 [Prevotella sp.]|nr:hypothetical protein [Prevotella sp.]
MEKINLSFLTALLVAVVSMSVVSCSSDSDDTPSQASILQKAEGIIELKSGIGNWDAAYLTKLGYFCYKQDASSTANKYSSITYMPADGSDIVSLIATKTDNIPTQMVTKSGIVYFSFPNDSILELLYDDGKTVMMLDSIAYSKEELTNLTTSKKDAFKATLSAAASLLKKNTTRSSVGEAMTDAYGGVFEEVSEEPYVQNDELVGGITTSESGNYEFTETIEEWYDDEISEYVCNTLSLWTGKATYKVGGSSCTLSGTIWCPSNVYNIYGTYGIICDEEQSKLTVGNAEYEGTGLQSEEDLSYSVDFRGFKPNTTYYYKAYYKFYSSDHGNIAPKYGSPTDQVIYDTTVKSFKTGDNALTVDVVMCIDVTGSMSDIIGTVKRNAIGFYDSFYRCCEEEGIQLTGLNAQVIAYRDKNEDSNWLQTSGTYSLPDQRSAFDSFVNELYADGGGDNPESGLEALQTAFNKSDWGTDDGYHRQVIILWTDAPYLTGSYSDVTLSSLALQWSSMPSGRRLILFAPYGTDGSNSGSWGNLDGWTNLIHESDLYSGFNNFDYILKSIIGELTSKATRATKASVQENTYFRPNK